MARPRQKSRIQVPPRVTGFIPLGYYADEKEPVKLNLEEYEAIRLLDYENLDQVEAARYMEISRPTLTRIYDRARKKIALALTESHKLTIEGGEAVYGCGWYSCNACGNKFNTPRKVKPESCVLCDHPSLTVLEECV